MSRILIADDEPAICAAFARLLAQDGHEALIAASGRQAIETIERERPDACFMDVRMPDLDGLAALTLIRERQPDLPVVVMTAYGTLDTAMQALKLGAFDYLGKPLDLQHIRTLIGRMLHRAAPPTAGPEATERGTSRLIGQSAVMQEVFKLMALVADNDLGVLILGESGVGKELVAQDIHRCGRRCDQPFVAVNCAAIPENLLESELFGHERGAFTGAAERRIGRCEAAGAGTLFLDEVGELPPLLQAKLLRVIQERRFERVGGGQSISLAARLIAATNRDLAAAVAAGRFREDLFHRLDLVTLRIPPLRCRREDIPALAQVFLARAASRLGKSLSGFEPAALAALSAYSWPGNVRELENLISRSVLTAPGGLLSVHDLAFAPTPDLKVHAPDPLTALGQAARRALAGLIEAPEAELPPGLFHRLVTQVETELIEEALARSDGNQVAASRLLGLHRTTLRKKLQYQSS
jgi:DNA-binding NtrC family response regulator